MLDTTIYLRRRLSPPDEVVALVDGLYLLQGHLAILDVTLEKRTKGFIEAIEKMKDNEEGGGKRPRIKKDILSLSLSWLKLVGQPWSERSTMHTFLFISFLLYPCAPTLAPLMKLEPFDPWAIERTLLSIVSFVFARPEVHFKLLSTGWKRGDIENV